VPSPVLLAYSSHTGSTAEVAEVIAEVLHNSGIAVEVARMRNLDSLDRYRAVILGAPLYMGSLPSETRQFLSRHWRFLAGAPTWFFVLGPVNGKPEEFNAAGDQAARQLERTPWFLPIEVKIFGGRIDTDHMPFPYNFLRRLPRFPLRDAKSNDIRDWNDIRYWAANVATKIEQAALALV
jgi:menaquinone-dependent protoporphyrinogen oxidase